MTRIPNFCWISLTKNHPFFGSPHDELRMVSDGKNPRGRQRLRPRAGDLSGAVSGAQLSRGRGQAHVTTRRAFGGVTVVAADDVGGHMDGE